MHDQKPPTAAAKKLIDRLRQHALQYPEATEDFPWGHSAIKVKGKAFVFLSASGDVVTISMKLPHSRDMAADLPFTEPTGYGLGRHGWVTASLQAKGKPPIDLIRQWVDESYRAIAPKKLVATLTP